MIHVRIDDCTRPGEQVFRCGIIKLPEGDKFFFEGESAAWLVADCPACNPGGPKKLGTPISQLSGRPGHAGFDQFSSIAASWGYE